MAANQFVACYGAARITGRLFFSSGALVEARDPSKVGPFQYVPAKQLWFLSAAFWSATLSDSNWQSVAATHLN